MAESDIHATPAEPAADPFAPLIKKHSVEIERIKAMSSDDQMKMFVQLGVDPKALEEHYMPLELRAKELREMDAVANKKVVAANWISFVLGAGAAYGLTSIGKLRPDSKLVRGFVVGFSGPLVALGGSFAASRLFAGKIREQSMQLDVDAEMAFKRELAVALENHENGLLARPAAGGAPEQAAESSMAANVPKRDAGFATQVASEKAAPTTIQIRV